MSFGYAISDVIAIGGLAYKLVQNSRKACGEHDELTREVSAFHVVLQRVEIEIARPSSPLNQSDNAGHGQELTSLFHNSRKVLQVLNSILDQYNMLSDSERSVKRLWKKIRFGNGEMADVADYRAKLVFFTTAITLHLNLATVGAVGRVERKMIDDGDLLKDMKISIDSITAHFISKSKHEGSVLTTYADDDKTVWREFRRELIQEGFLSADVKKNKRLIKAYVQELGKRGILDDEEVTRPQEVLVEKGQQDRVENGDQHVLDDDAGHISVNDEKDESETWQSKPMVVPLPVECHTASSVSQRTLPLRTPRHAYVETDVDSASDFDGFADDKSVIGPVLSESAGAPIEIPVVLPRSEPTSTLTPSLETRRQDDQVDAVGRSKIDCKRFSRVFDEVSNGTDEATIHSDPILEADCQNILCILCSRYFWDRQSVKLLCGDVLCYPCFDKRMTDNVFVLSEWEKRECPCGSKIVQYQSLSLQNLSLLVALRSSLWGTYMNLCHSDASVVRGCNDPTCKESRVFEAWRPRVDAIDCFIAKWVPFPMSQRRICWRCKSQICAFCNSKWRNYHCCEGQWQMLDSWRMWLRNLRPSYLLKLPKPTDIKSTTDEKLLWCFLESTVETSSEDLLTTYDAEQREETLERWGSIAANRQSKYIQEARKGLKADWAE